MMEEMHKLLENNETKQLRELTVTASPLIEVPVEICRLHTALHILDLSYNQIKHLPDGCFNQLLNLATLRLTGNHIMLLQDGLFDGLSNLRELHVDDNHIEYIGLHVFSSESDLLNLQYINMSGNHRLVELDPWPIIRLMAVNGTAIISLNNARFTFTNRIGWRFKCRPPLGRKEINLGAGNFRHVTDILKGWKLNMSDLLCLARWSNPSRGSFVIDVADTQIDCDCTDFDYYRSFTETDVQSRNESNVFENLICHSPRALKLRNAYEVALDQFVCSIDYDCPLGCACSYDVEPDCMHVKCTTSNFSSLPDSLPDLIPYASSYHIYITKNKFLKQLESRWYLANTSHFEVTESALESVETRRHGFPFSECKGLS
jgi:hypothetical protein